VFQRIFIGLCVTNTALQENGKGQRGEVFDCCICEGTGACMNTLLAVAAEAATLRTSEIKECRGKCQCDSPGYSQFDSRVSSDVSS
jgi:hypothetical protein